MKDFLVNSINSSKILSYFRGPDYMQQLWTDSLAFRILRFLFDLPGLILQKAYQKWENIFEGSLTVKALRYLSGIMPVLTGLILILTMIVPDNRWHNIYSVFLIIFLALVFVFKLMPAPGGRPDTASVDYAAILFFTSAFLAGAVSLFPSESSSFLAYYLVVFAATLIMVSTIESFAQLDIFIKLIAVGTFITALYGIYQWKVTGIAVIPGTVDLKLSQDLGGRVYSTMGNSNVYGELLVLTVPFFGALILNEKSIIKRFIWGGFLAPIVLVLFKTGSRASWIAMAVAVVVFVFFRNKKLLPFIIVLGAAMLPFLPSSIYRRISTITNPNDNSVKYRLKIMTSALQMLKDFWITGVGLGHRAVEAVFQKYKVFGLTKVAHSHNLYLQIWLESGIAAFTAFLLLIFRMVRNTFAAMGKKQSPGLNNILAASLSAILGIMVMGLSDHVWFYSRIMFMFWTNVSIVFISLKLIKKEQNG